MGRRRKSIDIGDELESCDEGVRGLVRDLNRAGYATAFSCEGGPSHQFPTMSVRLATSFRWDVSDREMVEAIARDHLGSVPFRLIGPVPLRTSEGGKEYLYRIVSKEPLDPESGSYKLGTFEEVRGAVRDFWSGPRGWEPDSAEDFVEAWDPEFLEEFRDKYVG